MNLSKMPVQESPCKTCPFSGTNPIQFSPERYNELLINLMGNGQHFCHSANNQMICRGGRNIQLRYLCAIGALAEPTDKAFDEAITHYCK